MTEPRFHVCESISNRGTAERRWWQIVEKGPRGGTVRVVASTPVGVMRDVCARVKHQLARREVDAMCAALNETKGTTA